MSKFEMEFDSQQIAKIKVVGCGGGTVVCTGTPEEVAEHPVSYTGKYLKKYLQK